MKVTQDKTVVLIKAGSNKDFPVDSGASIAGVVMDSIDKNISLKNTWATFLPSILAFEIFY